MILKDETLVTQFLTIATLSDFVIGCSISPFQKAELLKAVKMFGSGKEYIMAVISSAEDQKLIVEADVSIAINARYKQSDALVMSDIIMKDFYSLTYLIFKHGTLCQRRLQITTNLFLYRTLMIAIVSLYFMIQHAFTAACPVN